MLTYLFLFISSFALGFIFLFILRRLPLKSNLVKLDKKIPYTGGVGFSLSFVACYFLFNFIKGVSLPFDLVWIIIFSLILLLVEFIDDLKDFSLKSRVIIQIVFVGLFLIYGKRIQIYFVPSWLNYLLSFLWIIGITNAFNHLDIRDGLCAGVALIAGLSFLTVSVVSGGPLLISLFLALCGALLAFLLFNFPPAKIFMGNSGSHFLGFLFATLSMYGDYAALENPIVLILPVLILAFPIIDTFLLIVIRLKKGIMPLKKSNDHVFLQLLNSGCGGRRALLIIYFIALLWGLSGIFINFGFTLLFFIFLAAAILSTLKFVIKIRSV